MTKRIVVFLLLFAGVFLLGPGEVRSAPHAVSEDQYWLFISSARVSVKGLIGKDDQAIAEGAFNLANDFRSYTSVTLQSGETVTVDNSILINELTSFAPDLFKIGDMLDALLDAHKHYPAHVFSAADLSTLSSITARPEFQWKTKGNTNPVTKWLQEQWQKFLNWLEKLIFGDQSSGQGNEANVNSSLPYIAGLLLVVIMFFIFRSIFGDLISEARTKGNGEESQEPLTADAAFQKAQSLSRGGDYRSAVRYLYLSSLLLLDERGLLRYDRSKTNREYLKSVAGSPELAGPLAEVIDIFDNVWYGYHNLDEETFNHYSARVEELKEKKQQ
jgi:hypothetical protein